MYFSSKRDTWLGLLMWIPIVCVIYISGKSLSQGQFVPINLCFLVLIVGLPAWIWFDTGYRVTDDELKIKSGPIRLTIPLERITAIERTRNPRSSPALSLDRLKISYKEGNDALISPRDQEGFINLILSKCPTVAINGNSGKPDGSGKASSNLTRGLVTLSTILILGVVGTLLYFSNKPAEYFIQAGTLKISGQYGETIKLSDVEGITLKEQIPEILLKTNGSGLGSKMKGYFNLKGIGQAKLFIDTQKPPFIFIDAKSGLRIVNTEKAEDTAQLYKRLLEAWQQHAPAD
ncbi:PH domain-containing protein [Desulfosporosinus sp. PR]|uniref:PH domain-containing protein n=1 Tax=Candidatus Desulfosporosinus nitrosoreducens TaxID=3401928 RepID=UPI0027EBA2F1|nr:PH domain-containing protein [Desulfosporosinus sp. PR]MDQ7096499.1 PH domain-containing protein [Desulfosporosinus sp. PR]